MLMEQDRDEKGGLTRWLTGRRFLPTAFRPNSTLDHARQRCITMNGKRLDISSQQPASDAWSPGTLPPAASLTPFAENVASQATSEGTRPAHCLQYHLRTTPPRTRYHLWTTPPRTRYHLRTTPSRTRYHLRTTPPRTRSHLRTTPPRTRQQPHPLNSWFDAVDLPRSQPFLGG